MEKKIKVARAYAELESYPGSEEVIFHLDPNLFEVDNRPDGPWLVMKKVQLEKAPAMFCEAFADWAIAQGMNIAQLEDLLTDEVRKQQLIRILAERL